MRRYVETAGAGGGKRSVPWVKTREEHLVNLGGKRFEH